MFLAGKTALVTGGGRGIGRAIAERLAKEGARVVVTGRTTPEIEETARAISGVSFRVDLADRADLDRVIARIAKEIGRVDVLVNNAGVAVSEPFQRTTDALWDQAFEVNVRSAFALIRALLPAMIEARDGRIINVASTAGRVGCAYTVAYSAAKHALVGMTRSLAVEVARTGVTVNAVCPGWVETRMVDEAVARISSKTGRSEEDARTTLAEMSPQHRLIEASEVAHLVAMLASPEARGIHGQAIPIDGGQVMA